MTIRDWSRAAALGGVVSVALAWPGTSGPHRPPTRPVVAVAVELLGSGLPSRVWRGTNLRGLTGLELPAPTVAGVYRLQVRVVDERVCGESSSKTSREVVVQ